MSRSSFAPGLLKGPQRPPPSALARRWLTGCCSSGWVLIPALHLMQRAERNGSGGQRGFDGGLVFRNLLLIFQMPKTGSQTVEASLQQCSLPHRTVRCHFLSAERLAELRAALRTSGEASAQWRRQTQQQLAQAVRLKRALRVRHLLRSCGIRIPKLEIITAVREPIGLGLSSVFQNYHYFAPTPEGLTLEKCAEVLRRPRMLRSLEEWFDRELRPVTRLDVYQTPFPRQQGYAIYENARARVLLYRFEALAELACMVHAFLGCRLPGVVNRNLGRHKPYRQQYDYARSHLRLPVEFVREHYRSKLALHFYSPRELAQLAEQWTGQAAQAAPRLVR